MRLATSQTGLTILAILVWMTGAIGSIVVIGHFVAKYW